MAEYQNESLLGFFYEKKSRRKNAATAKIKIIKNNNMKMKKIKIINNNNYK